DYYCSAWDSSLSGGLF
nr:immunoglobulin light chain junction region [Macaca mulatta]MOW66142.1 immunoglobulin light chain junction region [Macaca mulatta]MOW66177.1 immunoglobulin light chain junction region [Macaca mulatta]MOW66186.1 immunoglobulin light chain junction region [Macaca mulatta]MOW66251.1 immunoglobulin light chain junction region [Macaca mulatta]